MPGTITHLVIADKVLDHLDNDFTCDLGLILAGTIAPDAVHAKKGYVLVDKKRSHLKQNIPDEEFYHEQYYKLFTSRLNEFIDLRIKSSNNQLDIDIGYLVHLIVDEMFLQSVYKELMLELNKLSIQENSELFLEYVSKLKRNTDKWLISNYGNIEGIRQALINIKPFGMAGYLTEFELNTSRIWTLDNCFVKDTYEESKFISFDRMSSFIDAASIEIATRLRTLLLV